MCGSTSGTAISGYGRGAQLGVGMQQQVKPWQHVANNTPQLLCTPPLTTSRCLVAPRASSCSITDSIFLCMASRVATTARIRRGYQKER